MAKDLYAVLGVSKSASGDELKQAYRKMSKEWHPDKHKGDKSAETKFKAINEAYETLSDPKKRQMYDQFGSTGGGGSGGQGHAGGQGGFDFNNFSGNFGGFNDLGDLFGNFFTGRPQAGNPAEGDDIQVEVTVQMQDLVSGIRSEIDLRRSITCATCGGNGAQPQTKVVQCSMCRGTGQVVHDVNSFFGRIQQRVICPQCTGAGNIPETPCHACKGEGRMMSRDRVLVDIPAGIEDGQALRMTGQGNAGKRGAKSGDLYVRIRVQADKRFERFGKDIRSSVAISVLDAILGTTLAVDTLHGQTTLVIPEGTQPGQVMRIKGKGLPELGSSRFGDHYVTINVEVPKKLSKAERKIVEEWRGARG